MNLKRTAVVTLSSAAMLAGGAGFAQADIHHDGEGPKFSNSYSSQILSCVNLEIVDIPILSADQNNFDCSQNAEASQTNKVIQTR